MELNKYEFLFIGSGFDKHETPFIKDNKHSISFLRIYTATIKRKQLSSNDAMKYLGVTSLVNSNQGSPTKHR